MTVNAVDALEKLGLVRDALAPALHAGIELKATTGELVTFQSLPHLLVSGAAINLIDDQGYLAAVTFEGDDECAYSATPSFCQIAPDGSKTRFYLWAKGLLTTAIGDYRPGFLRLGDPLFAVQRDRADSLIRLTAPRAQHVFRDRMMPVD